MIIISLYRQEVKDGKVFIRSEEKLPCPVCLSELKVIGSKPRKAIDTDGQQQTYIIRRLRCKDCGTIHHELPDFLIPYKRHCRATVDCVATDDSDQIEVANLNPSTVLRIRRWWHIIKDYFAFLKHGIELELGINLSTVTKPGHLSRVMANLHKWIHTRSVIDVKPGLKHA